MKGATVSRVVWQFKTHEVKMIVLLCEAKYMVYFWIMSVFSGTALRGDSKKI